MVLRWLANHHYPAVEQVHIPTENPLKNFLEILDLVRPSTDIKAGWPIGEYVERGLYDYEGAAIVYLLSDGRIFNASQYPQRPRPLRTQHVTVPPVPADCARASANYALNSTPYDTTHMV